MRRLRSENIVIGMRAGTNLVDEREFGSLELAVSWYQGSDDAAASGRTSDHICGPMDTRPSSSIDFHRRTVAPNPS